MATRKKIDMNVFDAAIQRIYEIYKDGHRVVVSFSGGKDSGVVLEICILAAQLANRLPVEVVMRDEEIMYPGTFEYCERVTARSEVEFHWLVANQPIVNIFNRKQPYFWVFDPLLTEDEWVRKPPKFAEYIREKNIDAMTTPERFPPDEGKNLYAVLGVRCEESKGRMFGLFSSKSYITKPNRYGVRNVWPIYDWQNGDVWKAINDNKWDYNEAYDVFNQMGISKNGLRIAPPSMNEAGANQIIIARKAWPKWFEKVADRLPGLWAYSQYGKTAISAVRKIGESWKQCFYRSCIEEAPFWISKRAGIAIDKILHAHKRHAKSDLPEVNYCRSCFGMLGAWKNLVKFLYNGDPFAMKVNFLPYMEPDFFRPGAGTWGGKPNF